MKSVVRTVVAGGVIVGLMFCGSSIWADSPVEMPGQEISSSPAAELTAPVTTELKRGDVNGDGEVDMGDVIKLEREILEIEPPTEGADVNLDGSVDMGDVIEIERIVLGISTRA
jgi:hypothetical protein